jgi:hypothetical protein
MVGISMNQIAANPQKSQIVHTELDTLASMRAMVASLPEARQPSNRGLSPSSVLALVMLALMLLAIFQTYQRAMVNHDFLIIDDTEEMTEEDL